METKLKVVVYADVLERPDGIVFSDESWRELPPVSLDALLDAVEAFPRNLGHSEWVQVSVEGMRWSAGGDGEVLTVVVKFLQDVHDVAHDALIGLLSAWLYDHLKRDQDGENQE